MLHTEIEFQTLVLAQYKLVYCSYQREFPEQQCQISKDLLSDKLDEMDITLFHAKDDADSLIAMCYIHPS